MKWGEKGEGASCCSVPYAAGVAAGGGWGVCPLLAWGECTQVGAAGHGQPAHDRRSGGHMWRSFALVAGASFFLLGGCVHVGAVLFIAMGGLACQSWGCLGGQVKPF